LGKIIKFAETHVTAFIANSTKDPSFGKGAFLRNLLDAIDTETSSKLTLEELVENTIIFLVAGSDTTAVTTIYTIWALNQKPEVYKKFTDEIRTAFPDPRVEPTYEVTSRLVSRASV
jgi:cytochrome P450